MNVIGNDNLDGKGQTRSRILSEPHNEGFPMVTVFDGHGCVPDNAIDSFRMDKESSDLGGFPSDYTVGECAPFYAADGSTILYMGKASWETERHEPDYNSVMSGSDTKNKACKKEKFFTYHVLHARNDICFEDDGKYYSWDVATCDDDKVYRFEYSDFTCSTRIDAVEVPAADCSFDVDPFTESYTAGGADMLYTTRACHKEYPSAP
jgi:hypothetical protein